MPMQPLGRKIASILAIKLIALTLIYFLFFAAPHAPVDAGAVQTRLFAPAPFRAGE